MAEREALADDDVTLPRAAVNKMIKEMIPNMRVSNDARELILNCCTEFIHLISSEANDVCNRQMKKTISPDHILLALEGLGFQHYIEDVKSVLAECKTQAANKRRASTKLEHLGIPEEELLRQQQELFQQARLQQAQDLKIPGALHRDIGGKAMLLRVIQTLETGRGMAPLGSMALCGGKWIYGKFLRMGRRTREFTPFWLKVLDGKQCHTVFGHTIHLDIPPTNPNVSNGA
ncbi:predicted protein [Nematostella vectensis]|uniref:Protein Dr1 n=1 Tax=Nematostella vectensis TaxID=45351 RepID=A7RXF9_NEMVE|nr:predicted protein [Nematostella vectensis]|eukprot:XP_001635902.1 predicted protein [Nematostella vectensis]